MRRQIIGLLVSMGFILYGLWKLYHFFEPKIGPVGNGPSDTLVTVVWVLFSINMMLGATGVFYFCYRILSYKR